MTQHQQIRGATAKMAAPRYRTNESQSGDPLMIQSRTLGVPVEFLLASNNISRSGILLENHSNKKIPFNVNTLLELTIDPNSTWLQKPVQCVAKVIRMSRTGDGLQQYGIKIVQMDDSDGQIWDLCFKSLEKNAGHLLMIGSPADAGKKSANH